jgi:hypothetical protein
MGWDLERFAQGYDFLPLPPGPQSPLGQAVALHCEDTTQSVFSEMRCPLSQSTSSPYVKRAPDRQVTVSKVVTRSNLPSSNADHLSRKWITLWLQLFQFVRNSSEHTGLA